MNASTTPWIVIDRWDATKWATIANAVDFEPVIVVHATCATLTNEGDGFAYVPEYVDEICRAIVGNLFDDDHPDEWHGVDSWRYFGDKEHGTGVPGVVVVMGRSGRLVALLR